MTDTETATGRVLALLGHVAAGDSTANLSELSRSTGINRVTAMRLLEDLEAQGALERLDGGGHRIGLDFLKLAAQALRSTELTSLGRRSLRALSGRLQLTAYLVVLDGRDALYLMRSMPDVPLVSNIAVGSRVPAHLVTPGRVLLRHLEPPARRALLGPEPLPVATAQSPTTYADLEDLLAAATPTAWSSGGYEAGVDACAAAVLDHNGSPVAALSVAGPSGAMSDRAHVEEAVSGEARDLSAMLAG